MGNLRIWGKDGHAGAGDIAIWSVGLEGSKENCVCTKVWSSEGSIGFGEENADT